jgi:hypothetical protein
MTSLRFGLTAALITAGACQHSEPVELYTKQAKAFAVAATSFDSVALRRLVVSEAPLRWALEAARDRPAVISGLAGATYARIANPGEDTVAIVYHGLGECADRPIIVRFVGEPATARIVSVATDCGSAR